MTIREAPDLFPVQLQADGRSPHTIGTLEAPRGPPFGVGPGGSPAGETRIEYDDGYDPRRKEWEVDPDREIGSERT